MLLTTKSARRNRAITCCCSQLTANSLAEKLLRPSNSSCSQEDTTAIAAITTPSQRNIVEIFVKRITKGTAAVFETNVSCDLHQCGLTQRELRAFLAREIDVVMLNIQ